MCFNAIYYRIENIPVIHTNFLSWVLGWKYRNVYSRFAHNFTEKTTECECIFYILLIQYIFMYYEFEYNVQSNMASKQTKPPTRRKKRENY